MSESAEELSLFERMWSEEDEMLERYMSAQWEWLEDLRTANAAMGTTHKSRGTWSNVRAETAEALAEQYKGERDAALAEAERLRAAHGE